jgi:hypothetical protein
MAFQPGQSGNPGGRVGVDPKVREAARAFTDEAIAVLGAALKSDDPRVAMKAAEVLLDRGWGKAAQPVGGAEDLPPVSHSIEVLYGDVPG